MGTRFKYAFTLVAATIVMAAGVSCSRQGAAPSVDSGEPTAHQTADIKTGKVDLSSVLAKADKVDGAEDHVISNCPGCALAMEGSPDHKLDIEDYELHFCSDRCRDGFAENTAQSVMALKVPEPPG